MRESGDYFIVTVIRGGGTSYVSPLTTLNHLVKKIDYSPSESLADNIDSSVHSFSNLIIGGSSGGLAGEGLCAPLRPGSKKPRFTIDSLIECAFQESQDIFKKPFQNKFLDNHKYLKYINMYRNHRRMKKESLYPSKNLHSVLDKQYNGLTIQDSLTRFATPVLNYKTGLTNYLIGGFSEDEAQEIHEKTGLQFPNYKMSDAITGGCAAVPYIQPYRLQSIKGAYDTTITDESIKDYYAVDGGYRYNNPLAFAKAIGSFLAKKYNKKLIIIDTGLESARSPLPKDKIANAGINTLCTPTVKHGLVINDILRDVDGHDATALVKLDDSVQLHQFITNYTKEDEEKSGHPFSLDNASPDYLNALIEATKHDLTKQNVEMNHVAQTIRQEQILRKENWHLQKGVA